VIKVTEEMIQAYAEASNPWLDPDEQAEARLGAVLALVERGRCMEPKGHVWHPLRKEPS
jgi:hypothetical protein